MIEKEGLAEAVGASRPVAFSDGGGEVITRGRVDSSSWSPDESMRKISVLEGTTRHQHGEDSTHCYEPASKN